MEPMLFIKVNVLAVQMANGERKPLVEQGLCPIHDIARVNTVSAIKYQDMPKAVKSAISLPGRVWLVSETLDEIEYMLRKEQREWDSRKSNTTD